MAVLRESHAVEPPHSVDPMSSESGHRMPATAMWGTAYAEARPTTSSVEHKLRRNPGHPLGEFGLPGRPEPA